MLYLYNIFNKLKMQKKQVTLNVIFKKPFLLVGGKKILKTQVLKKTI